MAKQAERWMATRGRLSAAIRARHRSGLNAWILPALGRLRVVEVRAEHLEKLLVVVTATGRGADTDRSTWPRAAGLDRRVH